MKFEDLDVSEWVESARIAFGHLTQDPMELLALRCSQLSMMAKEDRAAAVCAADRARKLERQLEANCKEILDGSRHIRR